MALFTITGEFTETSGDPWVYEGDITYTGRVASTYGVDLDVALATVDMTGATITFTPGFGAAIYVTGGTPLSSGDGPFGASSTRRILFSFAFNASGPIPRTVHYRIAGTTTRASNTLVLRARGAGCAMAGWRFTAFAPPPPIPSALTPVAPTGVSGDMAANDLVVIRALFWVPASPASPAYTLTQPGWNVLDETLTFHPDGGMLSVVLWKRMVGLETLPTFLLAAPAQQVGTFTVWAFRGAATGVTLTDTIAYSWTGTDPDAYTTPEAVDHSGPPGWAINCEASLYRSSAPTTSGYIWNYPYAWMGSVLSSSSGASTNRGYHVSAAALPSPDGSLASPITFSHKLMQSGATYAARIASPADTLYSEDTFLVSASCGVQTGTPTGPSAAYGVY